MGRGPLGVETLSCWGETLCNVAFVGAGVYLSYNCLMAEKMKQVGRVEGCRMGATAYLYGTSSYPYLEPSSRPLVLLTMPLK